MKKKSILSICMGLSICTYAFTSEMQIFGGLEFAGGILDQNINYGFSDGFSPHYVNGTAKDVFFAPGLSLGLRVMPDLVKNSFQRGFFFRGRALIVVNGKTTATAYLDGIFMGKQTESYSVKDSDSSRTIMDLDVGYSTRYSFSDKVMFYIDLGINFTSMNEQSSTTSDQFSYWGGGIYTAFALQINLTNKLYLEFGFNSIINAFSSQKSTTENPFLSYDSISFEDGGRWDLASPAAYIHIGWRFNLEELRKKYSGE